MLFGARELSITLAIHSSDLYAVKKSIFRKIETPQAVTYDRVQSVSHIKEQKF